MTRLPLLLFTLAAFAACSDGAPTAPADESDARALADEEGPVNFAVTDKCDAASFNAAIGPGTCITNGDVTFEEFIAELTAKHTVKTWHNIPRQLTVRDGWHIRVHNTGGETHTFTEVEHYGGGIVPMLNELAETPEVAPECLELLPTDFIVAGGTFDFTIGEDEDATVHAAQDGIAEKERYQCCIHPWMRTTLLVKEEDGG